MSETKKILILLPDGIGMRNFAYTDFLVTAKAQGLEIIFWNDTALDLAALGYPQVRTSGLIHWKTHLLKTLRIEFDLSANIRRSGDAIYDRYRFPFSYRNVRQGLKSLWMHAYLATHSPQKGSVKVRREIKRLERRTPYYRNCVRLLSEERPDLLFCTNQRIVRAIAPMLAAQDLGIPTATFIFSWDNLPKATMALETDHYLTWSDHMKNELLHYYDYIRPEQVAVTGTPQFEPHFQKQRVLPREDFFAQYRLDAKRKYICFSGDDVTTSPHDPQYLSDTADAVRELNAGGHGLGIVFRRCPVDFSGRYDAVLAKNRDIITAIDPKWEKMGAAWNTVIPTNADLDLQVNTIAHCEMVINLGSSMVFDFVTAGKPCAFINYDVADKGVTGWSVETIYKFVHFRSMPSRDAVLWIDSPQSIAQVIRRGLEDKARTVKAANEWFAKINLQPAEGASARIVQEFKKIINA